MPKKICLTTGPSIFQENIHEMIEEFFGWNYVYINHNNKENLDEWAEKADIYFGGGGRDVFPAFYGSPILKGENMEHFDRARDIREIHLIKKMIELGKPIAGVCKNFQLYLSVFRRMILTDINYGGSTIAHSPSGSGIKLKEDEQEFTHTVQLNTGEEFFTNSAHHMGILLPNKQNQIPEGIEIVATAELGGDKNPKIIEWFRDHQNNVNMVQWHPEVIWKTNEVSQRFLEEVKAMVD